jgi:NNP family nitrate/nitrite transporter-like MFS transporter
MVVHTAARRSAAPTGRSSRARAPTTAREEAEATGADAAATTVKYKRQAAAVIGIAGAVGAFGGFQVMFRQASLGVSALVKAADPADKVAVAQAHADWSVSALWVFMAAYVVFAGMTWFFYLRRSFVVEKIPSLARAAV